MDAGERPIWDTEGPIQAEVFLVWLNAGQLEVTGPCGPGPWYLEVEGEHPVEAVRRVVADVIGPPRLVHSTSWRQAKGSVILSFVVVIDPRQVREMASRPIGRAELARSGATQAPASIGHDQVLEHGLRHLAWLMGDDATVAGELNDGWRVVLASYQPEPFRALS